MDLITDHVKQNFVILLHLSLKFVLDVDKELELDRWLKVTILLINLLHFTVDIVIGKRLVLRDFLFLTVLFDDFFFLCFRTITL